MRVEVHPDASALSEAGARRICELVKCVVGRNASIGLAGGSTPKIVYERLRTQPVNWASVDLWLSDERWVAPDDDESNGRMAVEALGPVAAARLVRPRWSELLEPADSAAHYEADIRRILPDGRSDLTLLGMGPDGHTASLFPGTDALDETTRWFVENHVPRLDTWRLTATRTLINASRSVMVMVAGEGKAGVLAEVLERPDAGHPIQLLAEARGDVVWLVDEAAASRLEATAVVRP
jgi:6-phosphogluconolactonase